MSVFSILLICGFIRIGEAHGQTAIPLFGNRAQSLVAETPAYRFHSDFWMNLHMYLYGISGGGPYERAGYDVENDSCFDSLEAHVLEAWHEARTFYNENIGELPHRRGTMREIRYQLNMLGRSESDDSIVADAVELLKRAAAAYESCLWELHDSQNRHSIAEWVSVLVRYSFPMQNQLSAYYRDAWPQHVVVDVAPYTDFAGANTESGPGLADHMMMASDPEKWSQFEALETLLHESSHIIFGARHGAISDALRSAAADLDIEVPRGLWHAISFYTSGALVQEVATAEGIKYTPYWIKTGLYADYQSAVVSDWEPYLTGDRSMDEASLALLENISSK